MFYKVQTFYATKLVLYFLFRFFESIQAIEKRFYIHKYVNYVIICFVLFFNIVDETLYNEMVIICVAFDVLLSPIMRKQPALTPMFL